MTPDDALGLITNPEVEMYASRPIVKDLLMMMTASPKIGDYYGPYHFVLEHGQFFINEEKDRKLGPGSQCFFTSQTALPNDPDLLYVEGYVHAASHPIAHGWNITSEGRLIDSTLRTNNCEYWGIVFDSDFVMDDYIERMATISLIGNWQENFPLIRSEALQEKAFHPMWNHVETWRDNPIEELLVGYHGSDVSFDKFRSTKECGIHFALGEPSLGRGAALHRIFQTVIYRADLKRDIKMQAPIEGVLARGLKELRKMDPTIYEVSLDVSSPLEMREAVRPGAGFAWDSSRFLNSLLDPGDPLFIDTEITGITQEEMDQYWETIEDAEELNILPGENPVDIYDDTEQEVCEYVGKFLAYKGFDSVIYENLVEGGKGIIVFNPDQITITHKKRLDEEFLIPHFEHFISAAYY